MNKKINIGAGIIFLILLALYALAGAPGILFETPIDGYEDSDGNINNIRIYITNESYTNITNITLYSNWSVSALKDANVMTLVTTNSTPEDATFEEVSSNYSQTDGWFNISLFIPSPGYYLHYYFEVCDNNSDCTVSSNRSAYYINVTPISRSAPIIALEYPDNGIIDKDGNFSMNVSIEPTDTLGTDGNVTLYWNWTIGLAVASNYTQNNLVWIDNLTKHTFINSSSKEVIEFKTDELLGKLIADNIVVWWKAYGCNNATTGAIDTVCSWSTENRTITVDYEDEETTIPTITLVSPGNGSVQPHNFSINFIAEDNIDIVNVSLWLNYSKRPENTTSSVLLRANTTNYIEEGNTSVTDSFSLVNMLDNDSNQGGLAYNYEGIDGFIIYTLEACDNSSNCVFLDDNYTLEIDTTPPIVTYLFNTSKKLQACQKEQINWTTDEASNYSIEILRDLYQDDNQTIVSSNFNGINSVNASNLIANTNYNYTIWKCDEHNNCNYTNNETFLFDWPLCSGYTDYSILNTSIILSQLANDTNASTISYWNNTIKAFETFTTALPSLGHAEDDIARGQAVKLFMDYDGMWHRNTDQNTSVFGDGFNVSVTYGWNFLGLLDERTPDNITYSLWNNTDDDVQVLDNASIMSYWVNNDTVSAYYDYIFEYTINANMTYFTGFGLWINHNNEANWTWNRLGYVAS